VRFIGGGKKKGIHHALIILTCKGAHKLTAEDGVLPGSVSRRTTYWGTIKGKQTKKEPLCFWGAGERRTAGSVPPWKEKQQNIGSIQEGNEVTEGKLLVMPAAEEEQAEPGGKNFSEPKSAGQTLGDGRAIQKLPGGGGLWGGGETSDASFQRRAAQKYEKLNRGGNPWTRGGRANYFWEGG